MCMRNGSKGQISLEYGLVIGFSLLILIPTIIIAQSYSSSYQDNIRIHEAQRTLDIIVRYADTVHLEGPPARRTIKVNLPANIDNITTYNKTIVIFMDDGVRMAYATAEYSNLSWEANYHGKGRYNLMLQSSHNAVRITDAQ
jgi:uncharacterized protein (UPF0333 family)